MSNVNTNKGVSFFINSVAILLVSIACSVAVHFNGALYPIMFLAVGLSTAVTVWGIFCYTLFLKESFSAPKTFSFSTSEILLGLFKLPLFLVIQGLMSKYWFDIPLHAEMLWVYAFMIMAYKIRLWKA